MIFEIKKKRIGLTIYIPREKQNVIVINVPTWLQKLQPEEDLGFT